MISFYYTALLYSLVCLTVRTEDTANKRSLFPWNLGQEETTEAVSPIPNYLPILKVHKYNGIQINPIHGPPIYFQNPALDSTNPISDQIPADVLPAEDLQQIDLLNRIAASLPSEDRLHEIDYNTLLPYVDFISEDSLERFRQQTLLNDKVNEKSKLLKIIDFMKYLKNLKLKPLKYAANIGSSLINKKKEKIVSGAQTAMGLLGLGSSPSLPPQQLSAESLPAVAFPAPPSIPAIPFQPSYPNYPSYLPNYQLPATNFPASVPVIPNFAVPSNSKFPSESLSPLNSKFTPQQISSFNTAHLVSQQPSTFPALDNLDQVKVSSYLRFNNTENIPFNTLPYPNTRYFNNFPYYIQPSHITSQPMNEAQQSPIQTFEQGPFATSAIKFPTVSQNYNNNLDTSSSQKLNQASFDSKTFYPISSSQINDQISNYLSSITDLSAAGSENMEKIKNSVTRVENKEAVVNEKENTKTDEPGSISSTENIFINELTATSATKIKPPYAVSANSLLATSESNFNYTDIKPRTDSFENDNTDEEKA